MSRLLDPQILISIKNLQLAAKTTVDSFMSGINRSNMKGQGLEFSQYRIYEPGDDLRWLDWKMYARSDRYYIRESEVDTSVSIRFIIDASNSMRHTDSGFQKIDYAKYLAASLGCLAATQGDAVGLYVLKDNEIFALPARKDSQHLKRFYHQLESIEPAGKFTDPMHYSNILAGNRKRELVIFITDFYQRNGELTALVNNLSAYRNEIIVFHLMGENELHPDYKGYAMVEDLETGETVAATAMQAQYSKRMEDHLSGIRNQLLNKNIFYRLMCMNEPIAKALRDFLHQRNKLTR